MLFGVVVSQGCKLSAIAPLVADRLVAPSQRSRARQPTTGAAPVHL